MKRVIQIEIEYPEGDMLNISAIDKDEIRKEAIDILGLWDNIEEGRWRVSAKVVETINEEELDKLAEEETHEKYYYTLDEKGIKDFQIGFKAGYRKAKQE